jgi:Kef-type K+ transport system membrane component KefB
MPMPNWLTSISLTSEVAYLLLIFGLLIVPKALQRFLIPAPLTCFGLGIVAALFLAAFSHDATLELLGMLGISSLFLFAGLEVDVRLMRRALWPLIGHLAFRGAILAGCVYAGVTYLGYSWQVSALLALALLTPSTGFILDTLEQLGLNEGERFWVTSKAIGGELLALLLLFGVLQSSSLETMAVAAGALAAMIVVLPLLFIALGRIIVPYAPGSEFSMLVLVGLLAAYLTKELGVYYLVGAFLAGFIARLLRERMPQLASDDNLHAVKLFASFFIPFYFFYRGVNVPAGALTADALKLGLAITAAVLPLRILGVWTQRRFIKHESARSSLNVALALTPTLIFTLVLATILRERFDISETLYGALLIYAALSTMLPSLVLSRPIDFELHDFVGPPSPVAVAATTALAASTPASADRSAADGAEAGRHEPRPEQRDGAPAGQ